LKTCDSTGAACVPFTEGDNCRFEIETERELEADGAIVNGWGIEIYDPEGKLLAVAGWWWLPGRTKAEQGGR
jgi:hypothetical protein